LLVTLGKGTVLSLQGLGFGTGACPYGEGGPLPM
jgi:hypothetical protein